MKGFSHFSNGLTENLTDSKKVKVIFSEIVKNAREVVAKRVFINLLFPKIFRDLEFYQISPEQRNFNNKISKSGNGSYIQLNMGDLEKNSQKEFLFVGSLDATDDDSFSVADIKVSFDIPSLNLKNQEKNMKVYLNFSDNLNDEKFDSNVSNYKKELQLLLQYDEVKELNKKNKPIEAVKKLEKMVEIAKEIGAFDKVRIYNDFIKKLKSNNNLTQEDLNNLSYASSRTSLASMRERNIEANTEDEDYF
jgi:hypothetical protein